MTSHTPHPPKKRIQTRWGMKPKTEKESIERVHTNIKPHSRSSRPRKGNVYNTRPPRERRNETREDGVYHVYEREEIEKEKIFGIGIRRKEKKRSPKKKQKKGKGCFMRAGLLDSIVSVPPAPILRSHIHHHHPSPQVQPASSAACCKSRRCACNRPVKRRASESSCR